MINPITKRITELLTYESQIVVPNYQRGYMWRNREALDFFEDLKDSAEPHAERLFLGTMIFDVASEAAEKKIRVVDGQQRITTIILFLIACRQHAKRLNLARSEIAIQQHLTGVSRVDGSALGPKLRASSSIRDVLNHMLNDKWDEQFPERLNGASVKRQISRIKPTYDYFSSQIKNFDHTELHRYLEAVYDAYFIKIDILHEIEAFKIFERTNARGISLEASDLLKNHLLAKLGTVAEEQWNNVVERSDGQILRLLKYFYVSKHGLITKSKLFGSLKSYSAQVGTAEFVKNLDDFSLFFSVLKSGDHADLASYLESSGLGRIRSDDHLLQSLLLSLDGLSLFKITQTYPLIYAALESFARSGLGDSKQDSKKLISFFKDLESYHFVNTAVCDRIGNEVESLYADTAKTFSHSGDFHTSYQSLRNSLKDKIAKQDEFVARFTEISYESSSIPLIVYIFDRIENAGRDPGQRVKMFNPDPKLLRRNHNIEHFFPQKPDGSSVGEAIPSEVINNIGNLLVICFRDNSKLGNKSPLEKFSLLRGPMSRNIENAHHVQRFIEQFGDSKWDQIAIEARAKALAIEAYQKVWTIS